MNMDDDFPMMMEIEFNSNPHNPYPPVAVAFGIYPLLDAVKTAKVGHDFYSDVEFVKIAVPGDKNSVVFQPAADTHRRRFPKAYAEFKARTAGAETREGLPIEQWAPISRSVAMTLRAAHIHTVEALAAVHDGHIDRIGTNGRELRAKAQAFLEQAKDSSAVLKLAADKKELQDQLAAMQLQINQLVQMQSAPPATPAVPEPGEKLLEMASTAPAATDPAVAARQPSRRAKAE
jgi:hypothetical protein